MKHFLIIVITALLCLQSRDILGIDQAQVQTKEFYQTILLLKEEGYVIVPNIRINNSTKTYNFIFDTGSSTTSLSKRVADELNLTPMGNDSVSDGIYIHYDDYTYVDIKINGVCFEKTKSHIIDFSAINNTLCEVDGIIGVNLMKACIWQIEEDTITLTNEIKNLKKSSYEKQKFHLSSVPIIKVGLRNNMECEMILDLGDNTLIAFNEESVPYIRKRGTIKGWGQYYSTVYGQSEKDTFEKFQPSEPLIIGKTPLNEIVADINYDNNTRLGNIGSELLDYYNIIIDFPKKRLYTKQISTKYENQKLETFGFKYKLLGNKLFITYLWSNSPAQQAGIKIGQEIKQINGINVSDLTKVEPCESYKILENIFDKKSVTILLSNENKMITLTKASLFCI